MFLTKNLVSSSKPSLITQRLCVLCAVVLLFAFGCKDDPAVIGGGASKNNTVERPSDDEKPKAEDPKDDAPRVVGLEELQEMLDAQPGVVRTPVEMLTIFAPWDEDEIIEPPSLDEVREILKQDKFALAAKGLAAAGWTEDEAASIVFGGTAYNSGQPYDPVRDRSNLAREEMKKAIEQFEEQLAAVEEEQNIRFDRDALRELGIPTKAWLEGGHQ